jgi:hypothetical protein
MAVQTRSDRSANRGRCGDENRACITRKSVRVSVTNEGVTDMEVYRDKCVINGVKAYRYGRHYLFRVDDDQTIRDIENVYGDVISYPGIPAPSWLDHGEDDWFVCPFPKDGKKETGIEKARKMIDYVRPEGSYGF